ncbi:hypothetical protein PC129_g9393 [Phytophthora cactorum]|uniref:Uncharacterized protein n=1 Tax=Phytophthora cactorum TaxID=29920 RepID=A0A329S4C8_9STRA|nr:hypothetical protein Pcac1_g12519 [Phytophthora cactorum]KAG2824136.1 hypothetical protein PC112_g10226 [Phytophthora cactorum]KAG2825288.1 hypothetical protein PC111_g9463 [Phytophthora cactorum]KAG2859028.1 hypothetical protein PC113_g9305 [Phytophthora cactorum]KAG2905929.1 hypothetical protein PC114_g11354 [Phytophthora cactorum]
MVPNGVVDVVADIRQYWGWNHDNTDAELFANVQRQWESSRRSDDAAKDFVLQVLACGLEEQLLLWLLQPHPADAAEDIRILFTVCKDPYFTADGCELLKPMLDALLLAAAVRAAACDRNAKNRKQRMAGILEAMEGRMFSKTKSVLKAWHKSEISEEDVDSWTRFLELSNVLDPRVFNSRSGRDFMDAAEQIISLQQADLAIVRGSIDTVGLDGDNQIPTADMLWDLTTQIVGLIKVKADSNNDAEEGATVGVNRSLGFVEGAGFEEYLKVKASVALPCVNDSSDHEMSFEDDDMELSAIEQLANVWFSSNEDLVISRDTFERVFDELTALRSLDIISIQTSFLLGMQMRVKRCFVDHCDAVKDEFERRIRRVFNRFTGKAQDLKHVESLVVLAAFCPGQVIQQCIRGARTDLLHHGLYLKVLCASPLLLDWKERTEDETDSLLKRELRQTLLDISRNQSSFDRESQNVLSFLLSLVGIDSSSSSKRAPVVTMTELLDGVVNLVCYCPDQSMEMQLNLLSLIQQLFQHVVQGNGGSVIDPAVMKATFNLVFEALCSTNARDLRLAVLVRETLLLLLKNIMELMYDPASMISLDELTIPLNSSLWTLVSLFNNNFGNDELCKGLQDVAAVEAYMQEKSMGEAVLGLPLPNIISAIQVLLWGLFWDSTMSKSTSVESTKAETWRLLDSIAGFEFFGYDSAGKVIKGNLLIPSAVAEMMLECGITLFQALLCNVIPYLLEYEPTEISQEERLTIPKWAADMVSEQPEFELQISCQLVSTHSLMRYVVKCWGLSGAVNKQLAAPSSVLLVESLSHVLAAVDQAITSSQKSLSGTLFCIQWLCFLVSTASELRLDALSTWSTVRTQLELSLLRLMHQLEQLRETSTAEVHFSQIFVAAWLAYLPTGQFDQVFNFIATRTSK